MNDFIQSEFYNHEFVDILFAQSDIIHQSALELIHSEDRENFKGQLGWQSMLNGDTAELNLEQVLLPGNH